MKSFVLDRKNYVFVYVIGYLLRGIIYHFFPWINEILTALTILWPLVFFAEALKEKRRPDHLQACLLAFAAGALVSTLVNLSEVNPDAWLSLWQVMSLLLIFSLPKRESAESARKFYTLLAEISAGFIVLLAAGSLFLLACYKMNLSLPGGLADGSRIFTYGHMGEETRFCGLFGYSADGGNLCALSVILSLFLLEEKKWNPILAAVCIIIAVITVVYLDVRTSMVELAVVALILLYRFLKRKTSAKTACLLITGGLFAGAVLVFAVKHDALMGTMEQMREDPEKTLRFLTTGRSAYWASAWQGFLARPIFGYGWMNFTHMFRTYFDTHNLIFNLLFWTGLCGTVPIAVFAVLFLRQMVREKPGWTMKAVLLAGVLAESMLDRAILGTAHTAPETSFFWLSAGMLAYHAAGQASGKEETENKGEKTV